jgi:fumarate hydratase class II
MIKAGFLQHFVNFINSSAVMNTTHSKIPVEKLEKELEEKLKEYSAAEKAGKTHDELNTIYQEIKNIRYQITMGKD